MESYIISNMIIPINYKRLKISDGDIIEKKISSENNSIKTLAESINDLANIVNETYDTLINDLENEIFLKKQLLSINKLSNITPPKNLLNGVFLKTIMNIVISTDNINERYLYNIDVDDYFYNFYVFFPCFLKNNIERFNLTIKDKLNFLLTNDKNYLLLFNNLFIDISYAHILTINNMEDITKLFLNLDKILNNNNNNINITILIFNILVNISIIDDENHNKYILNDINKFINIFKNFKNICT
jgi:hypothetical protein